jgi:ribonuclease P protein component
MAVPRRVGGAVVRNRVKRYLRETYRRNRAHMVDDAHIVIVARPGAAGISYHDCAEAITRLFRKGNVLSE